jgi:hypothetical protein
MNSSLWSAGHTTHLKIVAVSLIASIAVVIVGINARLDAGATAGIESGPAVVKAGTAKTYTDNGGATIR